MLCQYVDEELERLVQGVKCLKTAGTSLYQGKIMVLLESVTLSIAIIALDVSLERERR